MTLILSLSLAKSQTGSSPAPIPGHDMMWNTDHEMPDELVLGLTKRLWYARLVIARHGRVGLV